MVGPPRARTATKTPIAVGLALTLVRWKIRGSQRLLNVFGKLGMLDVVVQHELPHGIRFGVPLFRNCWDRRDLEQYEQQLVDLFASRCEPLSSLTLFDCGADIGIFSALVCSRTQRIGQVIAFEPNEEAAVFLRHNLSLLTVPAKGITSAVSSFIGTGRLETPDYAFDDSCGRYLVPGDGPIPVTTIDAIGVRGGDVAIKVDVEGGELDVLKGAAGTVVSAENCVIAWEAHPLVARRTRRDPVECLRFLLSLRPFTFVVAETGQPATSTESLLVDGRKDVFNIVGWTSD